MFRFGHRFASASARKLQLQASARPLKYAFAGGSLAAAASVALLYSQAPARNETRLEPKQVRSDAIDTPVEHLQEEDAGLLPERPYNPETGEINWNCPCLGGMADGPCGPEFKEAFACFVYSTEELKGSECIPKFQAMQDCFRKYPEVYADQLGDDANPDVAAASQEASGAGEQGEPPATPASQVRENASEAVGTAAAAVEDAVDNVVQKVEGAVDSVVGDNNASESASTTRSNGSDLGKATSKASERGHERAVQGRNELSHLADQAQTELGKIEDKASEELGKLETKAEAGLNELDQKYGATLKEQRIPSADITSPAEETLKPSK